MYVCRLQDNDRSEGAYAGQLVSTYICSLLGRHEWAMKKELLPFERATYLKED